MSRGFYLGQPVFRVMKEHGYGRFVFIASSAGLFGQPEAAHYAAAKAGVAGLANVVSLEGAPHGILAIAVLPFGYTRMLTSTVGDRELFAEEEAFFKAIRPELVVLMVTFLASRSCELTHQSFSALGSLGSEVAEYDEMARKAISASMSRWEAAMREGLGRLRDNGALSTDAEPAALALSLIVALQGGLLLGKIHRSPAPLEVALDTALAYVAIFAT